MAVKKRDQLPKSAESADKTIKKFAPVPTDQYIHDSVVPGLVLRVTPKGTKLWHMRYQAKIGLTKKVGRKYTFGSFTEGMKTREAREIASEWRVRIRQGEDPLELKRLEAQRRKEEEEKALANLKAQKTLNDVALAYKVKLANPVSGHKDGGDYAMSVLENHLLSLFGNMPIKQFRREHLFEAVDAVLARGNNSMANTVLTTTKTMFRFAVKRGYLEYSPIDVLVKKDVGGPDPIRERVLCETQFKEDEIHELFLLLPNAGLAVNHEIAVHLLLGTACRVGELFRARWDHVNFDARIWIIPEWNSKNGDPLAVYLSDYTLKWLRKLYELTGHTDWLFPGRSEVVPHMCPKTISKLIGERQLGPNAKQLKNRTRDHSSLILPGGRWTVHDLRRTASTQMQMLGISPHVIDECQNHRTGNTVRRRYQHGIYYEDMKIAWNLLGQYLEALMEAPPQAKLVASLAHIPGPSQEEQLAMIAKTAGPTPLTSR